MRRKKPGEKAEKRSSAGAVKRLLPYYKPYRKTLAFDLVCAAGTTVCELTLPMLVRAITNAAVGGTLTAGLILISGGGYILLRGVDALASYYMSGTGHIMGSKMEHDLRSDLFAHLQKLSFSFFSDAKIGELISRTTSDLFDITEFAHHCPEELFIAGVKIVGAFTILCCVNVPLTLIIFMMLPGIVYCMVRFNRRLKAANREARREMGELTSVIEDSLAGVRVVKSFDGAEKEQRRFERENARYFDVKARFYRLMGQYSGLTRLFDGLMYIITVMAGAFFILGGRINAADLIAYLLYVAALFASIRTIIQFSDQFYKGVSGVERFGEIMDTAPEPPDAPGAIAPERVRGEIRFENVSFSYGENGKTVLSNIDLLIRAGEHVALAGPSGAGKTTFCSLIPRFWLPTGGTIRLDGTDVRAIELAALRRNVGVVEQDVYLFSGTVRENIAFGKDGATEEEIVAAAKNADAYSFIMALPNGFDTYVGERGVKLSGGQKQRISIARVFLKDPAVLILDEATSSLDNESELAIRQALERLAVGRTTLTVAHRLTTIRHADRILVLTEDGVAEEGSHAALMALDGLYAHMYRLYTTEEGEDTV